MKIESADKCGGSGRLCDLATKHDVELVRHEVDLVRREMTEMRQGLEFKIDGLRASLETKIDARIEAACGNLRAEIYQNATSTIRYMAAAIFGAMIFLVGTAYLFATYLRS